MIMMIMFSKHLKLHVYWSLQIALKNNICTATGYIKLMNGTEQEVQNNIVSLSVFSSDQRYSRKK
jgi:hypothetical protein